MAAPWKLLLQQSLRKNDKLRHAKYMQIATVRPDGRPANRTVVFRGFLWDTDRLTFVTDARCAAASHQAAGARARCCGQDAALFSGAWSCRSLREGAL
jgi:hypothetical protein